MFTSRLQTLKCFPLTSLVRMSHFQNPNTVAMKKFSVEDSDLIFKGKKTWELGRGYCVFSLCGIRTLMENNQKIMMIGKKILGVKLFEKLMKATVYGHFVGGETMEEVQPLMEKMKKLGVHSIIDYSAEDDVSRVEGVMGNGSHKKNKCREFLYQGEKACDNNMEMFLKSIDVVADSMNGDGFSALKVTALGRPEILLRISEILKAEQIKLQSMKKDKTSEDCNGVFHVLNWECNEVMEFLITGDDDGLLLEFSSRRSSSQTWWQGCTRS